MVKTRRTQQRRKAFLLDSNQTQRQRKAPKTVRNRLLNTWFRLGFFRDLVRLFTASRVMFLVILGMAGFILFAIFSPYFELKQIVVNRDNPNVDVGSVESQLEGFYGENLLFLDKELMKIELTEAFPAFREIEIQETWPASLTLNIVLSPPAFTLLNQTDASFWVVSEDGVILSEKAEENLPLVKVFDYTKPLQSGARFVEIELLSKITLAESIMVNQIKIPVTERRLYPLARELHLVADSGTVFWLDLQLDIENQLKKIEYGANRIGLINASIEHVDLRIPNQLYWKPAP